MAVEAFDADMRARRLAKERRHVHAGHASTLLGAPLRRTCPGAACDDVVFVGIRTAPPSRKFLIHKESDLARVSQ
jgi:hypothetical protein